MCQIGDSITTFGIRHHFWSKIDFVNNDVTLINSTLKRYCDSL